MGVVSSYAHTGSGVAGAVVANQYLGATQTVGATAVGGNHIVPAVDWSGGQSEGTSAEIEVDDFVWIKPRGDAPETISHVSPLPVVEDDIPKEWNLSDSLDDELTDPDFDPEYDPLDDDGEDDVVETVSVETPKQIGSRGPGRPRKIKVD